jgi:enamine deaminase RidA (YjgF/YER057c/UK114 family)
VSSTSERQGAGGERQGADGGALVSHPRLRKDVSVDHKSLAEVPYEYAAVAPSGATLFTAGACPLDQAGRVVAPGDHGAQAERAVDNLLAVLEGHGAGPADLVKTTVFVVGARPDLVAVWGVVAARLRPHRPPSTLLGVTALGYPDQLVEIEGIAALPRSARPR